MDAHGFVEPWERPFHIFSAYNTPMDLGVDERVDCEKAADGKTHQSMRDECDINKIVAKYDVPTLQMLAAQKGPGMYLDVSEVTDFRAALEHVREADDFFMALPAELRAKFENDTATFVDWMADPANEAESRKLGLRPPDGMTKDDVPAAVTPAVPKA